MAAGQYMLSGDFSENYEKFDGFFKVLEGPEHFRRYKKLVIDREEFNSSCSSKWDDVFKNMIQRDADRTAELASV